MNLYGFSATVKSDWDCFRGDYSIKEGIKDQKGTKQFISGLILNKIELLGYIPQIEGFNGIKGLSFRNFKTKKK